MNLFSPAKITTFGLALLVLIAYAPTVSAANEPQSGEGLDCTDFLLLWAVPGVFSPLAQHLVADDDTGFEATNPSGNWLLVDFYDDAGNNLGYAAGPSPVVGTVPTGATIAIVCVDPYDLVLTSFDYAFTYRDGL